MRKHTLITLSIALASVLAVSTATAEPLHSRSRFGLGLELGAPSGLEGKYFLGGMVAIQGGLGVMRDNWYYRYHDGLHLHAEVVWHPVVLHRSSTVTIPLHVGVGARILDLDGTCWDGRNWVPCSNDTFVGVRAPFGVSFLFGRVPMDVFVELALVIDVLHLDNGPYMNTYDRAGLDGTVGGRFYF